MRSRALVVALAVLSLLCIGLAWYLASRSPEPELVVPSAEDREPPPPLPYTFQWRDGAVRSVDVPMRIHVASLDATLPLYPVADIRSEPGEDKLAFLQRVLDYPAFRAGEVRTGFVDRHKQALLA